MWDVIPYPYFNINGVAEPLLKLGQGVVIPNKMMDEKTYPYPVRLGAVRLTL